jgi:RNA polymerase sigma-70 factor (ECF subfamily)
MRELTVGRRGGGRPSAARPALAAADDVAIDPDGGTADFAEIVRAHRTQLQRYALHLAGNPELAKDLVQETLLRGLRNFRHFRPGSHPASWLLTILGNLFFDHLKHQRVERSAEPELATSEIAECDPAISDHTDDQLYAAIRMLEPELREVVELCYLKQMRYREVAAVLNLPIGTIGTRLMRARDRLRALLTRSEDS